MATTKRMPAPPKTQSAVRKLIDYIINPVKTTGETASHVSSFNCSIASAALEFKQCRDRWDKNTGNYAYHFEQSFKPGEISPAEAHECGRELAQALWGDEFQVVIGTHLDKDHIHNHFAVCAVSVKDGHKLQTDHAFIRRMRAENDRICREHNLSVITEPKKSGGKSYAEWLIAKNGGFTWRGQIREDIDSLLPQVSTFKQLLQLLKDRGYTVKYGAHISVSPPGTNKNFRLYKVGDGYSPEQLADRINGQWGHRQKPEQVRHPHRRFQKAHLKGNFSVLKRRGGLRGLYFVYLYRIRRIAGMPGAHQQRYPIESRRDVRQIAEFAADLRLLSTHRIDSAEELAAFYNKLTVLRRGLKQQRRELQVKLAEAASPDEMNEVRKQLEVITVKQQKVSRDLKSCNRIFQRSQTIRKNQSEIISTEKGLITDGSRSRSNGYPPAPDNGRR